ncbi:hypothetical protein GGR90_003575 [Sphingopyxis italica]|uniref:Uncharacterized protein n=1 Tax=Sphingopyxis italica TaxID=1129133 RepID=A0A7X6BAQ3_9SPHN|nr:hypothetical protein [Sphingopyxis italica]NJB91366.1 hypothetical protein [Sphingopyxis italica]
MAVFEKMRVSLALVDKTPLYGEQEAPARSRREFFEDAFRERRDFLPARGKAKLTFWPIAAPSGFVAGFFGREIVQKGHSGPETAFTEILIENWEISLFVMNVAADSQVCWMQIKSDVGSPKSILESFLKHISKKSSLSEWTPHVKYMDTDGFYWEAVRANKDVLTKLEFTFIPPNALNLRDTVGIFTRLANEQVHPDTITHTYRAPPGQMEPESELAGASAEIAMEGGGEAKAFAGKKKVYDSNDDRTREEVDDDDLPTPSQPSFIRRVIDRLWPT